MFTSASLYYLGCTSRNRVTAMVRKLRQPKYIIGLALTVGYFWLIFVANPAFGAGVGSAKGQRENASLIVGGFYVLQVVFTWFALSSGRGVAFRAIALVAPVLFLGECGTPSWRGGSERRAAR